MNNKEYNDNNIFYKIWKNIIQSDKILETDYTLIFKDINPTSKTHLLAIPKGKYTDFSNFCSTASSIEQISFWKDINHVIEYLHLCHYQILSNCGEAAGQTVFHFHVHITSSN
jgi:histidine triad (HIT) family protein